MIGAPVALTLAHRRGTSLPVIAVAAALVVGLAVGIGSARNDDYLDDRYRAETAPRDFPEGIRRALAFVNREDLTDARIAVVGGKAGFKQYVFYGSDLSNHVQYVADTSGHGTYRPIGECEQWREALNEGDYDYVVISPDQRTQSEFPVEVAWTDTRGDASRVVVENTGGEGSEVAYVYELTGELDPRGCIRAQAPPPRP